MVDFETVVNKQVIGAYHVVVTVVRKMSMETVAGLARFAVSDAIREDDEVCRGIKRLAWAKKLAAKSGAREGTASATGAVHDQHSVGYVSCAIAGRFAYRCVVQTKFRDGFTGLKGEVGGCEIALGLVGILRPAEGGERQKQQDTMHQIEHSKT